MAGYYGVTKEFKQAPEQPGPIGFGLSLGHMTTRYGTLRMNSGVSRVLQSFKVILSTKRGTRFFNPTFGSDLHKVLFEQNVFDKQLRAKVYAKEALDAWEPRVEVLSVEAVPENRLGKVSLLIQFRVKGDGGLHETQFNLTPEGGYYNGEPAQSN